MAPPRLAQGPVELPEVHEPEYNPHRVFIKMEDLERHGFTAGCRRCILMRESRKAQGVKHQDECRLRVEQAMRDADHPRLHRAEHRALDELERRAALDEMLGPEVPEAPMAPAAPEAPATPIAHDDDDMEDVQLTGLSLVPDAPESERVEARIDEWVSAEPPSAGGSETPISMIPIPLSPKTDAAAQPDASSEAVSEPIDVSTPKPVTAPLAEIAPDESASGWLLLAVGAVAAIGIALAVVLL